MIHHDNGALMAAVKIINKPPLSLSLSLSHTQLHTVFPFYLSAFHNPLCRSLNYATSVQHTLVSHCAIMHTLLDKHPNLRIMCHICETSKHTHPDMQFWQYFHTLFHLTYLCFSLTAQCNCIWHDQVFYHICHNNDRPSHFFSNK